MMTTGEHPNGTLASHASAFARSGLCVLPARRRGDEKKPAVTAWKQYQDRLPYPVEIRRWFSGPPEDQSHGNSMCIVCGSVSGNLEMIDFDLAGAAFDEWRETVEAIAPGLIARLVIETTPSGGRHVVYRCEGEVSGNLKLATRYFESDGPGEVVVGERTYTARKDAGGGCSAPVTMIETRGEGGLFLCAPSPGYELVQGTLDALPVITTDERETLLGAAWAMDETPQPVIGGNLASSNSSAFPNSCPSRPGDDFNARGDVRDILTRHGWRMVRSGENEHWCRPGKAHGTSATLKGGVFYVFTSNAPPFEPQKGYAPFAVCAMLDHGGDFQQAAKALGASGYGEKAKPTKGVDLSAFRMTRPDAVDEAGDVKVHAPIPVGELVQRYPAMRKPVIHGLLREGETMNIIAAPKTGKSWLATDLAIAVATGADWLGAYKTEPGDVLIMDNELHPETSAHRIPLVAEARGVAMDEIGERIYIDNLRGRLQDINSLAPYFESIEPGRYKVIVLDAFYRFMPAGGDENDNGTMANIYNAIDLYADRLRCSFVMIHHSSKGSQAGKSVTDVGAGAGAQSRATDTHLVLRPHEDDGAVVLDAAVRSWPPIEPVCLRREFPVWEVDHSLDATSLKREKGGSQSEKNKMTPAAFVAKFVEAEPATRSTIIERAVKGGVSGYLADRLIRTADNDGLVHREGDGNRGKPYFYSLGDANPMGRSTP